MNTESTMNMQTSLPQTDKMTVSATTALPQTGDRLSMENETIKIQVNDLKLYYGNDQALKGIDMVIPERKVTAFIGPSGCGKSTLLRCFNRMNEDRKSTRLNSSHVRISYAVFCLKKKKKTNKEVTHMTV